MWSGYLLDLGADFLVGNMFFCMRCVTYCGCTSLLWFAFFFSSAVKVLNPQAYRKLDVTRKRISGILNLGEKLLSFLTDFGLVNAAVVCANLESISGLEPSSNTTQPWYLKLVTVSSFCPFTLISLLMLL